MDAKEREWAGRLSSGGASIVIRQTGDEPRHRQSDALHTLRADTPLASTASMEWWSGGLHSAREAGAERSVDVGGFVREEQGVGVGLPGGERFPFHDAALVLDR